MMILTYFIWTVQKRNVPVIKSVRKMRQKISDTGNQSKSFS